MKSVELRVDGMSCGFCVKSIEGALHDLGIEGKADLSNATVTVKYDERVIALETIKEAIEEQGFKVSK